MKSVLRTTGIVAGITALAISSAHAQPVIGGGGSLGIFSAAWSWFTSNVLLGLVVLMIVGLGLALAFSSHFHIGDVGKKVAGAAIIVNAIVLATALMTGMGG